MAKKIFISFAKEDFPQRWFLVGQARTEKALVDFTDMALKEAGNNVWRAKCREKIKECDGMIIIVTANTLNAQGQLWEIVCAKEEQIPRIGIWGSAINRLSELPPALADVRIENWAWENIKSFLNSIKIKEKPVENQIDTGINNYPASPLWNV